MSGVWAYYPADSRVFKVEAELVIMDYEPGADLKYVAKKIRLTEEVEVGGNWNTGDGNTGDWNTGDWNTGDGNTGNWNTGNRNTGNRNTGNRNTGDGNTGNWNTGNRNTGNRNTGNWNTGNRNTGDGNTGDWNTTDYCSGFFCQNKQYAKCFDVQTKLTHKKFRDKYWRLLDDLSCDLAQDQPFEYQKYKKLPGWSLRKIKSLHKKHIEGRRV
jgi:hypothetical protein